MEKEKIAKAFRDIQFDICQQLESADNGGTFVEDAWQRDGGGGGFSRVLRNGSIIEKGGVNFSEVYGDTPEKILKSFKIDKPVSFYATGVSIVIHPSNPFVPIIHMNIRYFEMGNGTWWFGGGIDLTPHYILPEDAHWFHVALKEVCDRHDKAYYPKFKSWADDYFYIKHRNETRGIGGIFFDRLNQKPIDELFDFVCDVGNSFAPIYTHFMLKHRHTKYNDAHKAWQYIRRGRYAEFNLVWDQGTRFGLETNGRTESILMSLPPMASWEYDHAPSPESSEYKTLQLLQKGINWADGIDHSMA
ncbi:MAG: oxygen-dependent coproporphyrinogen oxidase [Cyclobacteriaceae bacterium]